MFRGSRTLESLVATALLALAVGLVIPASAQAKGGPPGGESPGNNLSVPTYFIGTGGPTLRTACTGALISPSPATAIVDGYYLQKTEAVWSSECSIETSASVEAVWGSNLTNGRDLGARRPIRVEMALLAPVPGWGYVVDNLTPDLPDRQAVYGIAAGLDTNGVPNQFTEHWVWAPGATLTIEVWSGTDWAPLVGPAPISAEINSTGKVVFGYNWGSKNTGTALPGTYRLTFAVPAGATITGVDPGEAGVVTFGATYATVEVDVVAGGGKN